MNEAGRLEIETVSVGPQGAALPGFAVAGERIARRSDGAAVYVLNPPRVRRFGTHGDLLEATDAGWDLEADGDGARLRSRAEGAQAELLRLPPDAARALDDDDPEELTTLPAFTPFGRIEDLGDYYVDGRILTGVGHKRLVDSTALSLYRIARLRGGALWSGVADLIAGAIAARVESAGPDGLPHDLLDAGETHVRYLNDSLLLMAAHREWRSDSRFDRATDRLVELLRTFTVPFGGGEWVLHDSLERDDGRNDLILNTHLQAMIALRAAGVDTDPHRRALDAALAPVASGPDAKRAGRSIRTLELARALGTPRIERLVRSRRRPYVFAAKVCADQGALTLPGGWIARDLRGDPAPAYYATVNLVDLGGLLPNLPEPGDVPARLDGGIRFAQRSRFFRAEARADSPLAVLIPVALRLAGRDGAAESFADRLERAGVAPAIGWPGYTDALWSGLAPGTP